MIIIAGATGYIGKYLSVELTKKGRDVLALGRNPKAAAFLKEQGVPFMEFDLLNDADYDKLPTENIEAVVNLAVCLPEHEAPLEAFFDVNMTGNYKLLEFARKNGVKRYVMASSHKVYWDITRDTPITEEDLPCFIGPHSPYIISKIAAENFLQWYSKDFDMDCIVLRFTGVHGFGALMGFLEKDGSYTRTAIEVFIDRALEGKPIEVWGDTSIKRLCNGHRVLELAVRLAACDRQGREQDHPQAGQAEPAARIFLQHRKDQAGHGLDAEIHRPRRNVRRLPQGMGAAPL